jgi:hypothetical protein
MLARFGRFSLGILVSAVALASPAIAIAWGQTGHRVVGEIAQSRLSPAARQAVGRIAGGESLARLATWPDDVRSDPAFKFTTPWHFIEIPEGQTLATATPAKGGNALLAMQDMEKRLRSGAGTIDDKRFALSFIVHLVGDIHQPLHVGNGVDAGANACQVRFFGEPTNLHSVWDSGLIDQLQLSFTEYARFLTQATSPAQAKAWARGTYADWITESQSVRAQVYPVKVRVADSELQYCAVERDDKIEPKAWPNLAYDYHYTHRPLLDQRLAQAGIRLAAVLNRIFGP